ncbi:MULTISPECIES: SufE family protein [Brevibacterium]|jgi:cysteine desulfuration protein SufE|uniref:SufE family protein n=1 Tax=Brevibacterium salitolerans TaxID=1403566 RepID=A0ABN2WBK6_9MICO|nr:SufE family protein [Brevibacterium sp.]
MSAPTAAASADLPLPASLQEIADDFAAMPEGERLQLLLEFSDELPALPPRLAEHPELLEPVPECQSPIFVLTELDDGAAEGTASAEAPVRLFFSAPAEAPTTRGFAGILAEGLDGHTAAEILSVPADFPLRLSLTKAVSPLRLNGMSGMLARIQRQVREHLAARP